MAAFGSLGHCVLTIGVSLGLGIVNYLVQIVGIVLNSLCGDSYVGGCTRSSIHILVIPGR